MLRLVRSRALRRCRRFTTQGVSWGDRGRGCQPGQLAQAAQGQWWWKGLWHRAEFSRCELPAGPSPGGRAQVFLLLSYWLLPQVWSQKGGRRESCVWSNIKNGDSPFTTWIGQQTETQLTERWGALEMAKLEVTRKDFSYCKSQWKIIHSFWFQTKYTFHPVPHCVQIKLFTNTQSSLQDTQRQRRGGRHGDLDWRTARHCVPLIDPCLGVTRATTHKCQHALYRPTASEGSLFSLPQSLDKGQSCRIEPTHCRGNLKTATPPSPHPTLQPEGWTAGRALVPYADKGPPYWSKAMETGESSVTPPCLQAEVTSRLFCPTLTWAEA